MLTALAEAAATCTEDSARYALDCIQLRGTVHKIIATDGRQLLVRSGFGFPWDGDLLIKGSPIFACKAFAREQPVQIGKTDTHVVLRVGPWTIWSEIQKDARFPRVEDAIPAAEAVTTRVRFDPEDARFLATALDRLPGSEELNSPATIDMNGKVAIRARGAEQSRITELVLNRSELLRPADPHQHEPEIPEPGPRARLRRGRHLGRGVAGGLSGRPPDLRLAAARAAMRPSSRPRTSSASNRTPDASSRTVITTDNQSPRRSMSTPIQSNGHEPAAPANSNGHASQR